MSTIIGLVSTFRLPLQIKQSEVQNSEPVQKKANYTQVSLTTGATNNKEHYEL